MSGLTILKSHRLEELYRFFIKKKLALFKKKSSKLPQFKKISDFTVHIILENKEI
jgi:hypothetical protein